MKVCMIPAMTYPVPAVKGGAVEGLVELFMSLNEKYQDVDLTVVSSYSEEAKKKAEKYQHTQMIYIKYGDFVDRLQAGKFGIYANLLGIKLLKKNLINIKFTKKIYKEIKNQKFDLVIIEGGGDYYNYGYLAKKIDRSKLCMHLHGEIAGNTIINKWFSNIICVSNYISRRMIMNGVVHTENVYTLPNCVDNESFSIDDIQDNSYTREKYGIEENDFVYIYWGRMLPEKGVRELIRAFKMLSKETKNVKLMVVGNAQFGYNVKTEFDAELQEICNGSDVENKIIFTGFVPHNNLKYVIKLANATVLPSIWDDPAPLTIFEALSAGNPLITTRVGGIPEVAKESNSLLVDWNCDFEMELYKKMKYVKDNYEQCCKLSQQGIDDMKNYTSDLYYSNYVDIMKKCISKQKR